MTDVPETVRSAEALRRAIAKLNRRFRAQDEPQGVGSTGLSILGRLFYDGPATATDLAARERLQPQSLTRALRSMEERGLIARTTDASDRRRSTIAITDSGLRLLRHTVRGREAWLAGAMDISLSPTECEVLRLAASLMERLADADG